MKHLIHIGYPKSASTFLQLWFFEHPQLYCQEGAIAGFSDVHAIYRRAAQKENLEYKYFVTTSESLVFPQLYTSNYAADISFGRYIYDVPFNVSQKRVCDTLKSIFPGSQILLITRGFEKLILSAFSQYARSGGESTWQEWLTMFQRPDMPRFAEICDYNYIYQIYAEAFGAENLIVLPFELLRDDKEKFMSTLEESLDLDHHENTFGRVNESLSAEELYWYPRISSKVASISRILGTRMFFKCYNAYVRRLTISRFKPLAKILSTTKKVDKITERDIPLDFLEECRGKASVLAKNPLYSPYKVEYLLDD